VQPPKLVIMAGEIRMLTLQDIAEQAGLTYEAARKLVSRARIEPVARIGNVYDPAAVQAALDSRPGYGAPGRPKPHRPPVAE
jgi:hypothetical protein